METNAERRRRKLIELCAIHGGPKVVADKSGLNWQALDQVIKGVELPPKKDGTRSKRNLGDPAARAIEHAFGLTQGWFDTPNLEHGASSTAQEPETVYNKSYWPFTVSPAEFRAALSADQIRTLDQMVTGLVRSAGTPRKAAAG